MAPPLLCLQTEAPFTRCKHSYQAHHFCCGWNLLVMQRPDRLCKLSEQSARECGDVMACFTSAHYVFGTANNGRRQSRVCASDSAKSILLHQNVDGRRMVVRAFTIVVPFAWNRDSVVGCVKRRHAVFFCVTAWSFVMTLPTSGLAYILQRSWQLMWTPGHKGKT